MHGGGGTESGFSHLLFELYKQNCVVLFILESDGFGKVVDV